MENRNFQLDTEWNVIHYPYQPSGFGILIIGDERNFVDQENNFWVQNEGRLSLLNDLKNSGYTIFYSNLYGKNWGSDKSVQLAKQLYDYVIRSEILNEKIHLVAEGMGTLTALKLIDEMNQEIRSVVLINPILSLKQHLQLEKEHKFFYKKMLREIAAAFGMDYKEAEGNILEMEEEPRFTADCPLTIIHILAGKRAYQQSEISNQQKILWEKEGKKISITYMLPEKKSQIGTYLIKFFKSCETIL